MSGKLKIFTTLIILGVAFGYSFYQKDKYDKYTSSTAELLKFLPSVEVKEVYTSEIIKTDELKTKNYKGIFVHFWGTWCAPCEAELPAFLDFAKVYDKNYLFMLIAVNDEVKKIQKFLKRFKNMPKNVVITIGDSTDLMYRFGTSKVPETYLFSGNLKYLSKFVGPQDWSQASFQKRVDFLTSHKQ
jgi:cytochrome c biogenesis protein CcmG, thiol:disulfide interchange protein DsbE